MRLPALAAAPLALGLTLATVTVAPAAVAHDGTTHLTTSTAAALSSLAEPLPSVTSPNVRLVGNVPETTAISMEFSPSAPFAYVSSLDTISVLDLADPRAPKVRGTLVNALFENEAMTYGEKMENGRLTRFVIAGIDLYQVSP